MTLHYWLFENVHETEESAHHRGWSLDECLLTEFGRAGRGNIWLMIMTPRTRCTRFLYVMTSRAKYFPVWIFHSVKKYIVMRMYTEEADIEGYNKFDVIKYSTRIFV